MNISSRAPHEKARDYALRILRGNIVSLALEPGCRLSENELAAQMGLSRTPVREALIELRKFGIVEIIPHYGSVISRIDYNYIEEAHFMRLALETAAVQQACDMASEDDLEALGKIIQLQKKYHADGDAQALLAADNQFHRKLFAICNKLVSFSLMENMAIHFDRIRQLALSAVKKLPVIDDHINLLEAIRAHDKLLAWQFMTVHLNRYKTEKSIIKKKYQHFFRE